MMFPDRAPDDQYLYTTFVGGSHNRDLAGAPTYKSYFDYFFPFSVLATFFSDNIPVQDCFETTCDF
jgi:hypothetical protein